MLVCFKRKSAEVLCKLNKLYSQGHVACELSIYRQDPQGKFEESVTSLEHLVVTNQLSWTKRESIIHIVPF